MRTKKSGSVLIDALVGIFILGMGAVAYFGLLPVVHRSQQIAQQESKAGQIAARIAEEYGMLKPSEVNATTLTTMNLIDSGQTSQPWTVTHIPLDDATDYSPSKALENGAGTVTTSTIANGSILVTIQITWKSASGKSRSFTTGTIIGGYR